MGARLRLAEKGPNARAMTNADGRFPARSARRGLRRDRPIAAADWPIRCGVAASPDRSFIHFAAFSAAQGPQCGTELPLTQRGWRTNKFLMAEFRTSCSCGQAGAILSVAPRVRFRCHCTKCQSVYRAPFGDGLVSLRNQAKPIDPDKIEWIHTIRFSPLSRGLCKACGDPVLAHLYGIFSIVPARTAIGLEIPSVDCDIYYSTRAEDQNDDVPKHFGALKTYLGLTVPFLRVLSSPGLPIKEIQTE